MHQATPYRVSKASSSATAGAASAQRRDRAQGHELLDRGHVQQLDHQRHRNRLAAQLAKPLSGGLSQVREFVEHGGLEHFGSCRSHPAQGKGSRQAHEGIRVRGKCGDFRHREGRRRADPFQGAQGRDANFWDRQLLDQGSGSGGGLCSALHEGQGCSAAPCQVVTLQGVDAVLEGSTAKEPAFVLQARDGQWLDRSRWRRGQLLNVFGGLDADLLIFLESQWISRLSLVRYGGDAGPQSLQPPAAAATSDSGLAEIRSSSICRYR